MITFALIAGLGLLGPTALSSLPASQAPHATAPQDPAKDRYDRLVAEANDATAAWGKRVAALRAAELKGGDPVPAEAWESPMEAFIPRFVAAASDYDQYGGLWFYGEQYHQQYLAKPGSRPYCSAQPQGVDLAPFESWCPPGLESYAPKLPEAFWDAHKPRKGCSVVNAHHEPVVM